MSTILAILNFDQKIQQDLKLLIYICFVFVSSHNKNQCAELLLTFSVSFRFFLFVTDKNNNFRF